MRIIERMTFGVNKHPDGPLINYQNFGGYAWVNDPMYLPNGTTPEYPDRTVLLEKADGQLWPCRYTGGRYVNINNGLVPKDPKRWFYIRFEPEVWDPNGVWTLSDGTRPPTPTATADGVRIDAVAGQQLVDILKRSFTTAQIQDLMDASPYDEPDRGAPEAL